MSYYFRGMTVLTGSGNYIKAAAVSAVMARIMAAGGGAGGASSGLAVDANGCGGGAGGYGEKLFTSPASVIAYDCGTGGTGGPNSGTDGTAGGNASFSTLTANGGGGGTSTADIGNGAYAGAAGGAATATGDINCAGGKGGDINNTMASAWKQSGWGGHGILGSGGQGKVGAGSQGGSIGNNYGSGGAGPASRNNSQAGGNGSAGLIVLWELEADAPPPTPYTPGLGGGGGSGTIPFLMAQGQVYACPATAFYVFYNGTAPEISNDGLTWTTVPASNIVASAFIRSPGTDTVITVKKTNNKGGKKK